MQFLLINYSLKIKKLVDDFQTELDTILKNPKINTTYVIKKVYPVVENAFEEGLTFGNFLNGTNKYSILAGKNKKKLFDGFIKNYSVAEQVMKLKQTVTNKGSVMDDIIKTEFRNKIKKLVIKLITDAGRLGMREVV